MDLRSRSSADRPDGNLTAAGHRLIGMPATHDPPDGRAGLGAAGDRDWRRRRLPGLAVGEAIAASMGLAVSALWVSQVVAQTGAPGAKSVALLTSVVAGIGATQVAQVMSGKRWSAAVVDCASSPDPGRGRAHRDVGRLRNHCQYLRSGDQDLERADAS